MGRIFGTDGVRGVANTELTCEMAMNLARAAVMVLAPAEVQRPRFLVGMDSRISSPMLESAVAAGLCSVGADAVLLGVVPTPAVAYLVSQGHGDGGIMISASHNSFEYNGIKMFDSTGYKLSEEQEFEIEAIILDEVKPYLLLWDEEVGRIQREPALLGLYVRHLMKTVSEDVSGLRIAIDCSNGSASTTAREIFGGLGVETTMVHCAPDGININDNCGSTHVDALASFVKAGDYDAGFAFDGDADRCLAVDEKGNVLDGDHLLAILSTMLSEKGNLKKNTLVATVMSNMGLFKFAEKLGVEVRQTKVGDKYVLEQLHDKGYNLGGEQSGHIILYDYNCTGDGQLTALQVLCAMRHSGAPLSALGKVMTSYPQVMKNIRADRRMKQSLEVDKGAQKIIQTAQDQLGDEGRILVRPSGTEPLIRVMIEGQDQNEIEQLVEQVADSLHERLLLIS